MVEILLLCRRDSQRPLLLFCDSRHLRLHNPSAWGDDGGTSSVTTASPRAGSDHPNRLDELGLGCLHIDLANCRSEQTSIDVEAENGNHGSILDRGGVCDAAIIHKGQETS